MEPTQRTRKFGAWTTCSGESLHDALRRQMRKSGRFGLAWLPGTTITDGEHMYEVVYGCQGLGESPAGWVAAVRTDWIDNGPPEGCERTCYSLFMWSGKPRDGVIIGGKRRPFILRFVAPAPRLVTA